MNTVYMFDSFISSFLYLPSCIKKFLLLWLGLLSQTSMKVSFLAYYVPSIFIRALFIVIIMRFLPVITQYDKIRLAYFLIYFLNGGRQKCSIPWTLEIYILLAWNLVQRFMQIETKICPKGSVHWLNFADVSIYFTVMTSFLENQDFNLTGRLFLGVCNNKCNVIQVLGTNYIEYNCLYSQQR